MTAIVVSHDLASIFGVADRIAMVYQGRIHAVGRPAELRASTAGTHSGDPIVRQFLAGLPDGPLETPGF